MLDVHSLPTLRRSVLICAFVGWSDAGSGATGAAEYLALKWERRRFAKFDPDLLYSYTITRPVTMLNSEQQRRIRYPDLAFWAINLPDSPRDLVLLHGPEPDLVWRRCSQSIVELVQQVGVELVITLGSFAAPVSHLRPVPVFGRAYDPELVRRLGRLGLQDTSYQGPTSFTTAIADQARRRQLPVVGLWAATPSYLRDSANPKVSVALLTMVERLAGITLGLEELRAAGRDMDRRVDEALKQRPDLQQLVDQMPGEAALEAQPEPEPEPGPPPELPSPKAVLEDLEGYLRQIQQQDREPEE